MSNGLARASVRFRPAAFAGSFVALLFAAAIITACGTLLQTGLTAHLAPVRYAQTPVLVAADQSARISVKQGKNHETRSTPLPERARVDAALAQRIAAEPGVAAAAADFDFPLLLTPAQAAPADAASALTGRPFSAAAATGAASALAEGRAPGAGEVALDAGTAHARRLTVGDRITLTAPGADSTAYRISGLTPEAQLPVSTAWFADDLAGRLSGHPGLADAIAVQPRAGVSTAELARQVRQAVGSGPQVLTGNARTTVEQPQLGAAKVMLIALGGSFGGIATMTAVFVVMGTVALAAGQRGREFALLRAIGATPRQIRRTIATETMLLAPVAGAVGVLPGLALAHWWLGQLVARGAVPQGVSLSVGPIPMLAAVGIGLLAALGAGYLAARRPSRMRPSQALGEAAIERVRPGVVRTVLGTLALVGGVVLATVAAQQAGADAANTALGVVMCFLLAVALLGPLLAHLFATLLGLPLRGGGAGAAGSLAADNARANSRRLASAITPIVMVTAFCGTLLFLQTTVSHVSAQQVRGGIVADQVLISAGPGLPAGTADRAAHLPGVDAAVGVLRGSALYRSGDTLASASVLGVSGDPAQLTRVLDLGIRSGSLAALGGPGDSTTNVALDAQLAETLGVKVGDPVPFWLGDGTEVRPTLVATYQRGLGLGQVLLPRTALAGHVVAGFDSQVLVADAPGADHGAVASALGRLGVPALTVTDAAGFGVQADHDREINSWANTVMAAVLGGFAAVASANTLVMTVLDRRREVGLLRLAGTTRRQVRGMLRWEALLVASTGLLLGGAIAWTTLVPVARGLTGGSPYIPAGTAVPLAVAVVVLALAATALPGRALLRIRPVEAGAGKQ
ncbi:putative ABC transport system permease protein [Kitasatospora sp. MAA4]|uniref:ABC transporter permease n=1 Tax=Kitasatospora sp. MAA4 TaxID=3035093 RepID=UPI002476ED15|nr:FtsX-like permease family protein [Kitasatospora sp. MAA4]MDH6132752.1 putative ABC transport system permease protein [Kitasatospora sp. MAA4]